MILEKESRIIETEISEIQFETPIRESVDEKSIPETAHLDLLGNGVSFIMDKKMLDADVNGVDVNSLGFRNN